MAITVDDVRRIAGLAKLRLSPGEEERLVGELGEVLDYFEQVQRHAVSRGASSSAQPVEAEDVPREPDPETVERLARNAPALLDGFVVVPRVHGDG